MPTKLALKRFARGKRMEQNGTERTGQERLKLNGMERIIKRNGTGKLFLCLLKVILEEFVWYKPFLEGEGEEGGRN